MTEQQTIALILFVILFVLSLHEFWQPQLSALVSK